MLRYGLTLLQAPTGSILEVADAKQQSALEQEDADNDDLFAGLIAAAQSYLDGRDGVLGRALLTQQWRLTLQGFGPTDCNYAYFRNDWTTGQTIYWQPKLQYPGEIKIPLPPLQSVDAVRYLDTTGTLQTTDQAVYRVSANSDGASLLLNVNQSWPGTLDAPDSVQIDFTAGYETVDALKAERGGIIHAARLLVAHWFANREAVSDGKMALMEVPLTVDRLLQPHRIPMIR